MIINSPHLCTVHTVSIFWLMVWVGVGLCILESRAMYLEGIHSLPCSVDSTILVPLGTGRSKKCDILTTYKLTYIPYIPTETESVYMFPQALEVVLHQKLQS